MDAIQTIEPHELENWEKSCPACKHEKVIILRNHIAAANHNARIYTGHKMKFLREPKHIQQRLYNQEKKDVFLEIEYWLHNSATRHYGIRTITNTFVHPLPEKLTAECKCPEEKRLPTPKKPVTLRPLIMRPMGIDKFRIATMYF